ncbi:MAG: lysophospholipase [Tannerella sp.]|jgi:alpha-beta hydrolase superfamily lysophospholipase|nr:lysophospholipase [Tannerella sp.]
MKTKHIYLSIFGLWLINSPITGNNINDNRNCNADTTQITKQSKDFHPALRGIHTGMHQTLKGFNAGAKGSLKGLKQTLKGFNVGGKGTLKGLDAALRGSEIGAESATGGIGRAVYDESKMFYNPSRKIENMDKFIFEEKSIDVGKGITIYTYYFKSKAPKANIFFIHGNSGNVSTYTGMINTLISGGYNVYVADWRGYGKSTGRPDYKSVLKDTEIAFNDFLSSTRNDSLKVIVYGMSIGGQIATRLVCDRQQDVDAFIIDGSLSSAQNLAMDFMPTNFIRNSMKRHPTSFNQDYVAERDIRKIRNIPKLIIHSETDEVIAFYHGERLYENAQNPKFFWKTKTHHVGTLEELADEAINKIDRLCSCIK